MVYATVTFYCVTLVRAATVSYMTPCRHMHTWHMCTPTNLKVDELQAEGGWTEAVEALRTDGANKTLGGGGFEQLLSSNDGYEILPHRHSVELREDLSTAMGVCGPPVTGDHHHYDSSI